MRPKIDSLGQNNKKETPMWNETPQMQTVNLSDSETADQRSYLRSRHYSILNEKSMKARTDFGLEDDPAPQTPQEIIDRIKDGQFIAPTWDKDRYRSFYDAFNAIRWRNPKTKEDREGYDDYCETILCPASQKVVDAVSILDPKEALPILQAWENGA